MITHSLNRPKEYTSAICSLVGADSRPSTLLSSSTGLLSEHRFMWSAHHVWNTLLTGTPKASNFKLGQRLASELEPFVEPINVAYASVYQSTSSLGEIATFTSSRPAERRLQELETIALLITVRQLIDSEQLATARRLLEVLPPHILNDPQVIRLRSILAPPRIKRIESNEVDRNQEYKWIKNESQKHAGRWVALDGDQLLAEAESLRDLRSKLQMMEHKRSPLIHHIR